ncbi:MMPL family transporter [Aliifodinibius salicampi]|uniref:MMPL family transporter n=1 Tax=Fodinibius salicampi TaxID=1920655 RepID=A0ABT3PUX3_9BACT|nr:MMPL family transporter [Fodinibius salicampi]MCW9711647.1 MMPL family transporter [Fodinibius salicampi]
MEKILHFFRPLIKLNYKYPFWIVGITVLLAAVLGNYAVQLKIDTDLANLLPKSNPHVKALEELQETVGGETPMEVAIKSPSFEDNKRFAEDLISESMELRDTPRNRQYFERVVFHKETSFLRDNALYFANPNELKDIKSYLKDEIQSAKEQASPFFVDFEEDDEEELSEELSDFEESYESLIPSEYPISPDSTVMMFQLLPTGSKSNLSYLRSMFASYDSLVTEMSPESYNSEMEVRYGGRLKRHLSEIDSIMGDVFKSFASGISGVILLVMFYFSIKKYINYRRGDAEEKEHQLWEHLIRMPVPVVVIGLPLIISLAWTFGITYFALGTLNTMTSVLFVILFGMGIDYGIHFYARYIEFRSKGKSILDALHETYDNTGSAIVVSGLTTAFSLFVLIIARFRGFSEFGFIAGSGIILALSCMLFVLPALLVICERWNWILLNTNSKAYESSSTTLFTRFPMARSIVLSGLLVVLAVGINHQHLGFQYDFGELEPEFPEYQAFIELSGEVSQSNKRNPAYILADNQHQVLDILEKIRHKMETDTTSPTILDVEALPERFPPTEEGANQKLKEIAEIRELLNDPFIREQDDPQLNKLRRAAQTKTRLHIDQIPDYFKSQFVTKEGEIGNFVIVYPSVGLSDGEKSIAFKEDIGKITLDSGETFYAASTSIIAAEMLDLMRSESPYMVGATFLVVFLLMLVSFRSFRWAIIAMLPLVVGLVILFGIMMLTGMMFNFYNLVVLPAILGIGEDNGVHLAHRFREEGGSMWEVLSSTGQHVTVGSLTTILGFSGLLFTSHPGLQSLGSMAVIGIGMTLVTALTFLPALIQWLEDRNWIYY